MKEYTKCPICNNDDLTYLLSEIGQYVRCDDCNAFNTSYEIGETFSSAISIEDAIDDSLRILKKLAERKHFSNLLPFFTVFETFSEDLAKIDELDLPDE